MMVVNKFKSLGLNVDQGAVDLRGLAFGFVTLCVSRALLMAWGVGGGGVGFLVKLRATGCGAAIFSALELKRFFVDSTLGF